MRRIGFLENLVKEWEDVFGSPTDEELQAFRKNGVNNSLVSPQNLANLIKEVVGFKGRIEFDKSKPDGVQRKLIDSSLMEIFGFTANTNLKDGLALSYRDFLKKC